MVPLFRQLLWQHAIVYVLCVYVIKAYQKFEGVNFVYAV